MKVRMNPEAARLYDSLSPEGRESLRQWIKANRYDRLTIKDVAEEIGDATGEVLRVIVIYMLGLAALSLCFGIPTLTVRMLLENWQAILKIMGAA